MIIDLIKDNISIIEALQLYTHVHLSAKHINRKSFNIRCPFHSDNNPSFTVYTYTNTFRCWAGCNEGRSGDVINLVSLSLNINNQSAIQLLANDLNINSLLEESAKIPTHLLRRQRINALNCTINKRVKETLTLLDKLTLLLDKKLLKIETMDDLDRYGELYHPRVLIDYWMDCLKENDPQLKLMIMSDCNSFIERMIRLE